MVIKWAVLPGLCFIYIICTFSCVGETTAPFRRPPRWKPSTQEGQRRPWAWEGGKGEKAQRGGREGKGEREGTWEREGTREGEGAREGARQRKRPGQRSRQREGQGQRQRQEGTSEPLQQPPLQPSVRQKTEQIPWSPEVQKSRQGQREGTQTQQVRLTILIHTLSSYLWQQRQVNSSLIRIYLLFWLPALPAGPQKENSRVRLVVTLLLQACINIWQVNESSL